MNMQHLLDNHTMPEIRRILSRAAQHRPVSPFVRKPAIGNTDACGHVRA